MATKKKIQQKGESSVATDEGDVPPFVELGGMSVAG